MSVILKDTKEKRLLITKGAVDEIISICSYIDVNGEILEFTEKLKEKHMKYMIKIIMMA